MQENSSTETSNEFSNDQKRFLFSGTYLILLVAIALFAGATAYGVYKVRLETEVAITRTQSSMWLAVSLEREYIKLDSMFWRYTASDPNFNVDDLLIQFDILWSRLGLIETDSRAARPLRLVTSYDQAIPPFFQLIRDHEDQLLQSVRNGMPISQSFLDAYRGYANAVHQFMVDIYTDRDWSANLRASSVESFRTAFYSTLTGALVSTLLLFGVVILQLKWRQQNLQRTREALEQSRIDSLALREEVNRRQLAEKERELLLRDLELRNEELERYAYTISHDLKSPLYTIQGFTGFLVHDLKEGKTDKVVADAGKIKEAVQTMGKLLEDILNLSRLGHISRQQEEVSLNEVIVSALSSISRAIEEKAIHIQVKPDLPSVLGEPQRLLEVFQNLISNAVKFAADDVDTIIEIGASMDNEWVHCYVKDNGIGIEKAYQKRVFNLFERLDANTDGSGVGLSIVKRIIERHGGEISIRSEEGMGCEFLFTLPPINPERI